MRYTYFLDNTVRQLEKNPSLVLGATQLLRPLNGTELIMIKEGDRCPSEGLFPIAAAIDVHKVMMVSFEGTVVKGMLMNGPPGMFARTFLRHLDLRDISTGGKTWSFAGEGGATYLTLLVTEGADSRDFFLGPKLSQSVSAVDWALFGTSSGIVCFSLGTDGRLYQAKNIETAIHSGNSRHVEYTLVQPIQNGTITAFSAFLRRDRIVMVGGTKAGLIEHGHSLSATKELGAVRDVRYRDSDDTLFILTDNVVYRMRFDNEGLDGSTLQIDGNVDLANCSSPRLAFTAEGAPVVLAFKQLGAGTGLVRLRPIAADG